MIFVLAAGRVVAIVFIVIAAVVVALLIIPVTYKLDVNLDEMKFSFRIHWLFRLIRFHFRAEDELELALAVTFFTVDFLDDERRARRNERRGKRKKNDEKPVERSSSQRVISFLRNSGHAISLMWEYQVINEVMPLLSVFLFRLRPRDIHGYIDFGFKDPSHTGEVVGVVAAIPYIYQTELMIDPNFEADESYINGDVHASGHLMMLHVLILIVGMIRRENVRSFFGELRNRN